MTGLLLNLALGGAVFLGAATQRISGMGFALVASPFLVALLGPFDGVVLINLLGALTTFTLFATSWRRVEYRRVGLLLVPAVIAALPGALVARLVPSAILSVVVGMAVILTLTGSFFAVSSVRMMGRGGAVLAGSISGFMSASAGVGGPAVSAYAIAIRWPQPAFAVTVQPYFCALAVTSLAFKGALPQLAWEGWASCAVALVIGILVGHLLARVVRPRTARILVIVLAFAGAAVIVVKGAVELWGS
ncbi:MAG: sulfite exporter TauE/SafE family protein [Microbacterium sp.]